MTDATPPPDQPLGDQARARIRAELLAATREPSARARRWVVPAAAAASVALVAALTGWATGLLGGGHDGDGVGPATGTSATPTPESTAGPDDGVTPTPTDGDPVPSAPPTPPGSAACVTALEYVLRDAEQAVVFPEEGGGTTSIWVKGGRFSVCDERGGRTTVHQPLPIAPDLDDVATFRVSSRYQPTEGGGYRTIRLAAGVLPDGALDAELDVRYTFPDGHTEQATKITDHQGRVWWRMVYEYDDGGGNETAKPPIEVTVSLSGVRKELTLEWGTDTCAQANHGC
ncbi:hypothetical protein [Nocardioides sp.]|uniref:hypothetical protein n=1 Tax=Nocardioides sp. TaxID=35761 RepID=UPI001A1958A1|nr:hypothetical protein [Nocardioides sp.]MBJ7355959.1 hypothetical protein [Nocardioides sp.]